MHPSRWHMQTAFSGSHFRRSRCILFHNRPSQVANFKFNLCNRIMKINRRGRSAKIKLEKRLSVFYRGAYGTLSVLNKDVRARNTEKDGAAGERKCGTWCFLPMLGLRISLLEEGGGDFAISCAQKSSKDAAILFSHRKKFEGFFKDFCLIFCGYLLGKFYCLLKLGYLGTVSIIFISLKFAVRRIWLFCYV